MRAKHGENSTSSTTQNLLSQDFAKLFLEHLKTEHKYSQQEIDQLMLAGKAAVPDYIFTEKLTILESVVKYLKEELDQNYHSIAQILNRDERNIWHTYSEAKKKLSQKFTKKEIKFSIPLSVFANRKLSVLEAVTAYAKDQFGLKFSELAHVLKRDERTLWTVYNRAKHKTHAK